MNEIMPGEKDINVKIFWNYLKYHNSLFLTKDVIRAKQSKNLLLFKKKIPANENPKK